MIDIHSHILFGVDDGPSNKNETIEMFESAIKEGITEIVSTSHVIHPQYNAAANVVKERLVILQNDIQEQQIPLKLHLGHEIRLRDDLVELLKENKLYTLAGSKYLLLELPSHEVPQYTINIVQELISESYIPIIAHPERNKAIAEKPSKLANLINQGAIAQITSGSLAGKFGKKIQRLSLQLVDANLVHTYGSDAHNLTNRPFLFDEGLTYLENSKRLDAVDIFLENNARIIEDKEVIILEQNEIQKKKWWKF
ncbi:capsular biosynthesis protein [Bacillus sp. FJAT-22090]|uniref:tyrosine-protein phosphatase n=1 Tax=Bacillus sp. FJAT-22090 TaxID=1581038 RepID=UPI0006AE661B|nr:CpsB/CapC family capsule biosynthesis tyrosine phosphatase [Bacillus sp. FJAT-22090]ALC86487.1 capsular biosynthesis protein [Bacillus sp. FJAT-22090]